MLQTHDSAGSNPAPGTNSCATRPTAGVTRLRNAVVGVRIPGGVPIHARLVLRRNGRRHRLKPGGSWEFESPVEHHSCFVRQVERPGFYTPLCAGSIPARSTNSWPYRLVVKIPACPAENRGSIPRTVANSWGNAWKGDRCGCNPLYGSSSLPYPSNTPCGVLMSAFGPSQLQRAVYVLVGTFGSLQRSGQGQRGVLHSTGCVEVVSCRPRTLASQVRFLPP